MIRARDGFLHILAPDTHAYILKVQLESSARGTGRLKSHGLTPPHLDHTLSEHTAVMRPVLRQPLPPRLSTCGLELDIWIT